MPHALLTKHNHNNECYTINTWKCLLKLSSWPFKGFSTIMCHTSTSTNKCSLQRGKRTTLKRKKEQRGKSIISESIKRHILLKYLTHWRWFANVAKIFCQTFQNRFNGLKLFFLLPSTFEYVENWQEKPLRPLKLVANVFCIRLTHWTNNDDKRNVRYMHTHLQNFAAQ